MVLLMVFSIIVILLIIINLTLYFGESDHFTIFLTGSIIFLVLGLITFGLGVIYYNSKLTVECSQEAINQTREGWQSPQFFEVENKCKILPSAKWFGGETYNQKINIKLEETRDLSGRVIQQNLSVPQE